MSSKKNQPPSRTLDLCFGATYFSAYQEALRAEDAGAPRMGTLGIAEVERRSDDAGPTQHARLAKTKAGKKRRK